MLLRLFIGVTMGQYSRIEWTDSTWNPVTGCTQVSAGCDHCYALTLAHRRLASIYLSRSPARASAENLKNPFAVRLWPDRLETPLGWNQPRLIFVNSMSDLFHLDIPEDFTRAVFEVMLTADWHVYQVLTKRPARAARLPFFFKQVGGYTPKAGGRLLDGIEWDEFPPMFYGRFA